jgi:23S rRNA (cytidine1920-2'-O)/16S rRNA (cytidine1409-2'-O)-methyltransferase
MKKTRLDQLLVEKNLVESRAQAQRYIMAGQVRAAGQVVLKPSTAFEPDTPLEVVESLKYVSRGAEKLTAALDMFGLRLDGLVCADVGASTGGFTDCMLAHGAAKVYAIDVGHNILHWKLRTDERVVVMEDTNARYVETLPEAVDFISIDVSFISLDVILPVVRKWLRTQNGQIVALVKPQFEAGRREAARGKGVIRDPQVHRAVLEKVTAYALGAGWGVNGLIRSPITGPKGNIEFLLWLKIPAGESIDTAAKIDELLAPQAGPDAAAEQKENK